MSMYGSAFVQLSSSVGRHKSGTGSQMKRGFETWGLMAFRRRRMEVTREMQRVGEQIRWKDFENRSWSVRAFSSSRSLGAVYLKARFWLES
jgi:hypothetical protein